MSHSISNSDDIIDSRDVESRIDDLNDELKDGYKEYCGDVGEDESPLSFNAWLAAQEDDSSHAIQTHSDEAEEYRLLNELRDDVGHPEWTHGLTLINDDHFTEYAKQLADDIGAINRESRWPNTCIDWEQAAQELQMDYSSVDFDGTTYHYRS